MYLHTFVMGLRPLQIFNPFSVRIDFRRQNLTSKVCPRAKRIKCSFCCSLLHKIPQLADNSLYDDLRCYHNIEPFVIPLDIKGCICHFVKWQIHPFKSKGPFVPPWHTARHMSVHTSSMSNLSSHSIPGFTESREKWKVKTTSHQPHVRKSKT